MGTLVALMLPFIGTTAGAACVFFLRKQISTNLQRGFTGFAAGVMVAASVWSLLIPAMDMSADMGKLSFFPALVGFLLGILFLLFIDSMIPHLHVGSDKPEGKKSKLSRTAMLMLAVTIHNLPEGAACGAIIAGVLNGDGAVTMAGAITLSIGIAIQNFPEGAIISLPLRSEGHSKGKSFALGALSGIVEPIGAIVAILLAAFVTPILPYMLAFAAGAMIYVVVEELIPEASEGEHSNLGTIAFAVGFALMMVLDVALG
ncbi:MAG: ZIP family metal transporter [Eubacterium sp.]|nr:ZIP family metal transporter [Eubacterium sp.]